MTRDVIVNLRHPERLQVANRLRTLVENTVVEQHHLPKGRDQHGAVSLSDVHVVDLKGSIRLRECQRRQAQQRAQSVRHSQLRHEISPVVRVERENYSEGRPKSLCLRLTQQSGSLSSGVWAERFRISPAHGWTPVYVLCHPFP